MAYVSLFPFRFRTDRHVLHVLWRDLHYWPDRFDVLSNVLLYLPLGFFCAHSFARAPRWFRIVVPGALGVAMSSVIEVLQVFDGYRSASVWDISANAAGTLLGAIAGAWFSSAIFPTTMILCWIGFRLIAQWTPPEAFPFPAVIAPAVIAPAMEAMEAFGAWLGVGLLAEAVWGAARSRWILPAFLLTVQALNLWISDAPGAWQAESAAIAGGALACCVWISLSRWNRRAAFVAIIFTVFVAADALRPFHFVETGRGFGWIPFYSAIHSSREPLVSSMLAKAFMYGTMLWIALRAGMPAKRAVLTGTALVLLLRIAEIYSPGRSAEITDAILFLLLAGALRALEPASWQASSFGSGDKAVTDSPDREEMAGTGRIRF